MTRFYERFDVGVRLFVGIRTCFTSYPDLARHLPESGRFLDVGCGHGLMAATIALSGDRREVLAFDHDEKRIAIARDAYSDVPNLRFIVGTLENPPTGRFAAMTAIDVLHYLNPSSRENFIRFAFDHLEDDGVLLVRDIDATPGFASACNRLYETLAVAIGMTKSITASTFLTAAEWQRSLRAAGFDVLDVQRTSRLFLDTVFVCRKRGHA